MARKRIYGSCRFEQVPAAGGNFIAKAELSPHTLRGSHCTVEVYITEPSRPSAGGLLELVDGNKNGASREEPMWLPSRACTATLDCSPSRPTYPRG